MKRTEQLNVKITPELKKALGNLAKEGDWTIAHVANRLLEKAVKEEKSGGQPPSSPEKKVSATH